MESNFSIRTMSFHDVQTTLELAAKEGWNPGRHDAVIFHATDPNGFFGGFLEDRLVSCISAIRYGEHLGMIGLYIVEPEARGKGYGYQLWQAGMAHLSGRIIGGDGVVAMQKSYQKEGAEIAWRNARYEGNVAFGEVNAPPGVNIVDAKLLPFADIADYDAKFFPASRDAFLSLWISHAAHISRIAIRDDQIVGFAVARPSHHGFRVGPFYASDSGIARALLAEISREIPLGPLVIDIPEPNTAAVQLAQSCGMIPSFFTARMYIGDVTHPEFSHFYGITTYELG
jgi:GNAT superfamily N-acetyltransferase